MGIKSNLCGELASAIYFYGKPHVHFRVNWPRMLGNCLSRLVKFCKKKVLQKLSWPCAFPEPMVRRYMYKRLNATTQIGIFGERQYTLFLTSVAKMRAIELAYVAGDVIQESERLELLML